MPYRNVWYEPSKNLSLTILKELPEGIHEIQPGLAIREAWGTVNGEFRTFHFCQRCGGWIEGHSNEYSVNTLNPHQLSGRQGTEYYCARCGGEIGFLGLMS